MLAFSQFISQIVEMSSCEYCNITFTWPTTDIIFIVQQSSHTISAIMKIFVSLNLLIHKFQTCEPEQP